MRTTECASGGTSSTPSRSSPQSRSRVTLANYEFAATMGNTKPAVGPAAPHRDDRRLGVKVALLFIDWRKALLFVLIPHVFAVWGITAVNFVQHDGCDEDHPYNHSRNFVGEWFNWLTFNNGYHGMHHVQPGLHWTAPAARARRAASPVHSPGARAALALALPVPDVHPPRAPRDLPGSADDPGGPARRELPQVRVNQRGCRYARRVSSPPLVAPAPGSTEAAPAGSLAAPPSSWKSWLGLSLLDNRFPALHGLRVLAIVSVVAVPRDVDLHGRAGHLARPGASSTQSLTVFFGMDLFFVLSGFLIGSILLRSLEHVGRAEPPPLLPAPRLPHVPLVLPRAHGPRARLPADRAPAAPPAAASTSTRTNFLPLERGQSRHVLGLVAGARGAVLPRGAAALPRAPAGCGAIALASRPARRARGAARARRSASVIFFRHRPWNDGDPLRRRSTSARTRASTRSSPASSSRSSTSATARSHRALARGAVPPRAARAAGARVPVAPALPGDVRRRARAARARLRLGDGHEPHVLRRACRCALYGEGWSAARLSAPVFRRMATARLRRLPRPHPGHRPPRRPLRKNALRRPRPHAAPVDRLGGRPSPGVVSPRVRASHPAGEALPSPPRQAHRPLSPWAPK